MAASGEKLRAGVVVCQRLIRPDGAGGFTDGTNEHGQKIQNCNAKIQDCNAVCLFVSPSLSLYHY